MTDITSSTQDDAEQTDPITPTPVDADSAGEVSRETSPAAEHEGAADGADLTDGDVDDSALDDDESGDENTGRKGGRRGRSPAATEQLIREGDVAADYLETLLDVADLDGDIEVDVDGDRAAVAIVDSEEGRVPRRLVGRDGEVLEALQDLTRLAVLAQTGEHSRLMLDVAGHRAARRAALVKKANEAAAHVRSSAQPLALEPMTPFERKVVHDAVAAAGLTTQSEGVEPYRHVVILP